MTPLDDLEQRCVARRMAFLMDESDPWFAGLTEEEKCEAYLIAYLLGMEDAKDIRRQEAENNK